MSTLFPVTNSSSTSTVTAAAANLTGMAAGLMYYFVSSTNCYIKQGTTKLVTCVTNANMADGDKLTIAVDGQTTVVYEYDKSANGVASGSTSWAAGAGTAAQTAATLATAIAGAQPSLLVTDNADGTLTITAKDKHATITEQVANAGFLVATAVTPAAAVAGSMFVPAAVLVPIDGNNGPQLGVIRSTVDGNASLTRVKAG